MMDQRPFRSVLYIPASRVRALDKARGLPTDAIIFDLEDAVAADEKETARDTLAAALKQDGFGARAKIIRINCLDTDWGVADAHAVSEMAPDAVLLPKVDGPEQLDQLAEITKDIPIWAMMETPLGMLNAARIAAHPKLTGMVMGTNDLAKDMQTRFRPDRLALMTGLGLCLLAAKAHGILAMLRTQHLRRQRRKSTCRDARSSPLKKRNLPDRASLSWMVGSSKICTLSRHAKFWQSPPQ